MSLAEASRLAANLSGGLLQEAANALAGSACSDLARWARERNCVLGPIDSSQDALHQDHQNQYSYLSSDLTSSSSSLNNASTTLSDFHASQQATSHKFLAGRRAVLESPLSQQGVNLLGPMQRFESNLDYYFSDIWLSSGDERTNELPFIGGGPWKLVYATLIYLYLIKFLLPRVMKPFNPLELNWLIRLYNLFMVVSNMWAFYHGARILQFGLKCFGCETIDHQDRSEKAIELLHYGWLFFLSRMIEWLDTVFFVLRKKERQVTKLHVFHHSFVPLISWTYLKYHPGYTVAFFPFVNSFVHSIMYSYYLLATFGPKLQPYLWWKRYLTSLQIVQFVLIIIQLASIPLTGDETCQYPRGFLYVAFAGAILFLWLFYTYYQDTYTKNKQRSASKQDGSAEGKTRQRESTSERPEAMGKPTGSQREGSSRSLSDAVDNAISCEEPPNSAGKLKCN